MDAEGLRLSATEIMNRDSITKLPISLASRRSGRKIPLFAALLMLLAPQPAAAQSLVEHVRQGKTVFRLIEANRNTAEYQSLLQQSRAVARADSLWRSRSMVPDLDLFPRYQELREAGQLLNDLDNARRRAQDQFVNLQGQARPSPRRAPVAMPPGPPPVAALIGSVSPLPVIVTAATGFVLDRARQELVLAYVPRVTNYIARTELRLVLPQTLSVLRMAEHVDYRLLLSTLRSAMQRDVQRMPDSVLTIVHRKYTAGDVGGGITTLDGALLGIRTLRLVQAEAHPIDVLARANVEFGSILKDPHLRAAAGVVAEIARAYKDSSTAVTNLRPQEQETAWLLLGYAALRYAGDSLGTPVQDWLSLIGDKRGAISAYVADLQALRMPVPSQSGESRTRAWEMGTRAILSIARLLPDDSGMRLRTGVKAAPVIVEALLSSRYVEAIAATWSSVTSASCGPHAPHCDSLQAWVRRATPLLVLVASVAETDSVAEVEELIRSAAAPVGSYRDKRVSRAHALLGVFSAVSLDAYAGFGGGRENLEAGAPGSWAWFGSAYMPLGLEFTRAGSFSGRSLSVLISPFDLGAVAATRFTGDEVDKAPEIGWSQIVAPAAYLIVGHRDSPIATGIGVQRVSRARRDSETAERYDAVRASFFFAVNVVLYSLWQAAPD